MLNVGTLGDGTVSWHGDSTERKHRGCRVTEVGSSSTYVGAGKAAIRQTRRLDVCASHLLLLKILQALRRGGFFFFPFFLCIYPVRDETSVIPADVLRRHERRLKGTRLHLQIFSVALTVLLM